MLPGPSEGGARLRLLDVVREDVPIDGYVPAHKIGWLFRIVISASRGTDFPMIPRESALFSSICKTIALGIVPSQGTAEAPAPQPLGGVPWFVAPQGIAGSKAIDFYAFSWGVPRTPAYNLIETAQRESQTISL